MKKSSKILLVLTMAITLNVFSATEMDALRERITSLEKQLDTSSTFNIGGVIEVEYGFEDLTAGGGADELTLATAELGIAGVLNEQFDAYLTLLYEQGDNNDNIAIDEAVLNGKTLDKKYAFSVGRLYVPFGVYETAAISDPVGLDIGETNDEAIVLHASFTDGFAVSAWLADNAGAATNNSGLSLGYENDVFAFGLDWIDDMVAANNESGLAIHGMYAWGKVTFIAEHITENSGTNKAQSTQIEVDYTMLDWVFAIAHNTIDNFGDYDSNITLASEYTLAEGVGLALEYKTQDRTDDIGDDNVTTLRLAYEF